MRFGEIALIRIKILNNCAYSYMSASPVICRHLRGRTLRLGECIRSTSCSVIIPTVRKDYDEEIIGDILHGSHFGRMQVTKVLCKLYGEGV